MVMLNVDHHNNADHHTNSARINGGLLTDELMQGKKLNKGRVDIF